MDNKKNANNFYCKKCNYSSRNKYDYNKHLLTRKHKMDKKIAICRQKIAKPNTSENDENIKKTYDCICGKSYRYHRSVRAYTQSTHLAEYTSNQYLMVFALSSHLLL